MGFFILIDQGIMGQNAVAEVIRRGIQITGGRMKRIVLPYVDREGPSFFGEFFSPQEIAVHGAAVAAIRYGAGVLVDQAAVDGQEFGRKVAVGGLMVCTSVCHYFQGRSGVEFKLIASVEAMPEDLVPECLILPVVIEGIGKDVLGIGAAASIDAELHDLIVAVEGPAIIIPFVIIMEASGLYGGEALAIVSPIPGVQVIAGHVESKITGVLIVVRHAGEALSVIISFLPVKAGLARVGEDTVGGQFLFFLK